MIYGKLHRPLKRQHMGEFVLVILMIIYLIMGFKTPELVAGMIDNVFGKVVISTCG